MNTSNERDNLKENIFSKILKIKGNILVLDMLGKKPVELKKEIDRMVDELSIEKFNNFVEKTNDNYLIVLKAVNPEFGGFSEAISINFIKDWRKKINEQS